MSLAESVERARELLRRNGRVSLRLLRREFALHDDTLGELVDELVDVQRVAVLEDEILSWAGVGGRARANRSVTRAAARASRTPDGNYAGPTWTPSTSSRLDCVRRGARNRPRTIERPNG